MMCSTSYHYPTSCRAEAMFTVHEHSTVYVPIYVTPLLSMRNPAPPGSQTEMYAVTLYPEHPLKVGDAVHLHHLCPPAPGYEGSPGDWRREVAIPLKIKGRISGERERNDLEVEFVVMNDDEDVDVRRAFVRASADPRMSATPTLSATRRGLRYSERRKRKEGRATREADADLAVAENGSVGPRRMNATSGWRAGLGTERGARGLQQQASDRGRWVVCTPLEMEMAGIQSEERVARTPHVAPGPTEGLPSPWDAPSERNEEERRVGVGRAERGRSSEAPGRGPRDLYQN